MPLDRDIDAGYMQSWASQHPQRTNRLIAENNARVDRNVESGALTSEEGQKRRDFNRDFYTKNRGDIYDTIDRRSGNFIDRRPQPGIMNLFSRMFGGRAGDAARSVAPRGTYYPPTAVNQRGTYVDTFPEAKEVVGPRQYGTPITGTTTQDALSNMSSEIFDYGEDALLPEWAEQSTAMDKFGEARKGLYDLADSSDQGWTRGTTDEFYTGLNRAKMDAVKQLVNEYTQSGEFDYPDRGMVYGTDDYMGSGEMIPGYELGQGLGMDMDWLPERDVEGNLMGMQDVMHGDIPIRQLEPIQPIGSKLMSEADSYSPQNLIQLYRDALDAGNEDEAEMYLNDLQLRYPTLVG